MVVLRAMRDLSPVVCPVAEALPDLAGERKSLDGR